MTSRSTQDISRSEARAGEIFCTNLLQGIHAAAQPLTILRASLGIDDANRMSMEELRELAAHSAVEVERLCIFFGYIQQLVMTESIEPHLSVSEVSPLLAYVADGVRLLFKADGMSLTIESPEDCPAVFIDSARTHQALSHVLLLAHAVSSSKDSIEMVASLSPAAVLLVVRNSRLYVKSLNAEENLSMALAEANIRSQRGSLSCTLDPFTVQIELHRVPFQQ